MVKALNMAYADEAISIDDYRNAIPGINPLKTAKAVEIERAENAAMLVKMGVDPLENIGASKSARREWQVPRNREGRHLTSCVLRGCLVAFPTT